MTGDDHNLDAAYQLSTPEDSVNYYRDWAKDYDREFAEAHDYIVPGQVAAQFREQGGVGPVLDIGAGTGLVGAEMAGFEIDGIDISQEMLDVAGAKGLYRDRICADLTGPLDIADRSYQGFVCAGTFTHGHVGPVCLPELMRIAAPNALFVLAINVQIFDEAGFGSAFASLVAETTITPIAFQRINYYDASATHEHADDTGLLAVFRRM